MDGENVVEAWAWTEDQVGVSSRLFWNVFWIIDVFTNNYIISSIYVYIYMEDMTLHDLVKLCCLCFIPVSDSLSFTMFHYGNWRFVIWHRCLQVESPLQRTFIGSFFRKTMWLGSDTGTTGLRHFLKEKLLFQTSDSNPGSCFHSETCFIGLNVPVNSMDVPFRWILGSFYNWHQSTLTLTMEWYMLVMMWCFVFHTSFYYGIYRMN